VIEDLHFEFEKSTWNIYSKLIPDLWCYCDLRLVLRAQSSRQKSSALPSVLETPIICIFLIPGPFGAHFDDLFGPSPHLYVRPSELRNQPVLLPALSDHPDVLPIVPHPRIGRCLVVHEHRYYIFSLRFQVPQIPQP
jgi:hypothetical protein